ncbi:MAG: hypothetical protein ACRDP7_23740 [Trebonia sp.]
MKTIENAYRIRSEEGRSDGSTWCYVGSDADGSKYSFCGVFHGTPSPDGIVRTVEFVSIAEFARDAV